MGNGLTISGPFNKYDRKAFFKAFDYDDINGDGKIKGAKEKYQEIRYGIKIDKDGNGEITESELKDCLNDDQKLKSLLQSEEGKKIVARALSALARGGIDPRNRDWIGIMFFVHIIDNKNLNIPAAIRLLAMEYYQQAVHTGEVRKYIEFLKKKTGVAAEEALKEAQLLHDGAFSSPNKSNDLFVIEGPFDKYNQNALYEALNYGNESKKIPEPELKGYLEDNQKLKKMLESRAGKRAVARAVYSLIKGAVDPRNRDWINPLLFVHIIDNKVIAVPPSIRLLAMEYYCQAAPATKEYIEGLKKKSGIVTGEALKEAQVLHDDVVRSYRKVALPRVLSDPRIAPLLNPLLDEIAGYYAGLSEPVKVYDGDKLTILHYKEKPDYYLVYNKKGALVTIIPSVKPLETPDEASKGKLIAYYPFHFSVSFENFEKTIYRNNWCLKWLYRLAKSMNFHRELQVLSFSDKIQDKFSGQYQYSKEINIYWNANDSTIPHELCHYWSLAVAKEEEKQLFIKTSWDKGGDYRKDANANNFFGGDVGPCDGEVVAPCTPGMGIDVTKVNHPYGMTNWREDFATVGEYYIVHGAWMRSKIRRQMKLGNFEGAVKYLYFRYVSPVAGEEFGITTRSISLTIEEARQKINDYLINHPNGIRKDTLEVFDKIETISQAIRGVKRKKADAGLVPEDFSLPPQPPQSPPIKLSFKQKYPNVKNKLITQELLTRWGLTISDLKDPVRGWQKLSKALYQEDMFWKDLKEMNGNRSSPYWACWTDFYLPGEVVRIREE